MDKTRDACTVTIRGTTETGERFRPSMWTEMLISPTSGGATVRVCNGVKCIDLDLNSDQAERIMQFATDNKLLIDRSL